MSEVTWTHKNLDQILDKIPVDATTLLDVGCGRGIIGALFQIYRRPKYSLGIEGFAPYCESAKRYYSEVELWDLKEWAPRADMRFDVGTMIEVIEHLPWLVGRMVLTSMEAVCKRVILTTPAYFHRQPAFDGNPYQQHQSYWSEWHLRSRGYKCETRQKNWFRIMNHDIKLVSAGLGKLLRPGSEARVFWKDFSDRPMTGFLER